MMSLAQWKNIRRVDHVDLGLFQARFRAQAPGTAHMNMFDADVDEYSRANNNFDKVTRLAGIIQRARREYLDQPSGTIDQRYLTIVDQLFRSATVDLNQICGSMYQMGRTTDLVNLYRGTPLAHKNINLNVFYLAPIGAAPAVAGIDAVINNHIASANAAAGYIRAGITFTRTNPAATVATQNAAGQSLLLPVTPEVPVARQGNFADGGIGATRLIAYCNASGGQARSIDVVYLDHYDQDDVQGRTFRAGADYNGATSTRPIVTVTLNPPAGGVATYPTTLAHELGHALTGDPDHSADGSILMAGGANRTAANTLTDGQIAWFRNNASA